MKVLFVYSDISGAERYGAKKFYSGIGSLSAVLKDAGHQASLLYLQSELSRDAFLAEVSSHAPDVVGFSATTHQFPYVARYAGYLKAARPAIVLVCGGTHATLVPEDVSANPAFDVVCIGEGEYALRDLLERLAHDQDYSQVQNLWVRRGAEVVRNALRPLLTDLDELPYADRELFGYSEILAANGGWVDMMAGRGCPYNCSYCCNPGLRRRYEGLGRYVRFRGVAHIIGELRMLCECYKLAPGGGLIKTINFQDDVFTLDKRWTLDFCRAYAAEFDLPFWINARVERILDEEVVLALAAAGCAGVRIGVENGDEALRASVLKRQMSNDEIVAAFRLLRRHGLKAYTCNMIGIPGETPQSIRATLALNRELAPDEFQFSVFYPYPLTELYDTCVAQSLIRPELAGGLASYYARESVLRLPTLTDKQLAQGYEGFEALRAELALKRANPSKYRLYRGLLKLYRGDGARLRAHLGMLRRFLKP